MTVPPTELSESECVALLHRGVVGRVALCTEHGPRIVPVNYAIASERVIIRTSPYSELGMHGPGTDVAFEIDEFDPRRRVGWSVVAQGTLEGVRDDEVARLAARADPHPWAGGSKPLFLRLAWTVISGRSVGMLD